MRLKLIQVPDDSKKDCKTLSILLRYNKIMKKSKETNAFLSRPVKSMNVDIGLQLDDLL